MKNLKDDKYSYIRRDVRAFEHHLQSRIPIVSMKEAYYRVVGEEDGQYLILAFAGYHGHRRILFLKNNKKECNVELIKARGIPLVNAKLKYRLWIYPYSSATYTVFKKPLNLLELFMLDLG